MPIYKWGDKRSVEGMVALVEKEQIDPTLPHLEWVAAFTAMYDQHEIAIQSANVAEVTPTPDAELPKPL